MIIAPIRDNLDKYDPANSNSFTTAMTLHEVSHFLLEGSLSLFTNGAISEESKNALTTVG